jgi:hypothetical protein
LGTVLVLALMPPLVGAAFSHHESIRVAVVNLNATNPAPTDVDVRAGLEAVNGDKKRPISAVVVLLPQGSPTRDLCPGSRWRPVYCGPLQGFPTVLTLVASDGKDDADTVMTRVYGSGPPAQPVSDKNTGVFTATRTTNSTGYPLGSTLTAGAVLAVVGAAVLLVLLLVPTRRPPTPPPTPGYPPAPKTPKTPGPGPRPLPPPGPPSTPPDRRPGTQRVPSQHQVYQPAPLAPDVLAGCGPRVVAQSHFATGGGYVAANGLYLWASLAEPPDGPVAPGQVLTVLGVGRDQGSLVVSPARLR